MVKSWVSRSVGIGVGLALLAALTVAWRNEAPAGGDAVPPVGFYIPQFGHGVPPGSNLLLTTEVNVINLNEVSIIFQLQTYDADGNPLAMLRSPEGDEPVDFLELSVEGRGTVRIGSLSDQLAQGWGILISGAALGVEVTFNIFDAGSGELLTATNVRVGLLQRQATFLAFNQTREGPAAVRTPQGAVRRVSSGVALLNPLGNAAPAEVELSVFDEAGSPLGQTSVTLGLGERTSMFLDQMIEDLPDFQGTVRLRSFNPEDPEEEILIGVLPLRQEGVVLTTQLAFFGVFFPTGELFNDRFFFISQFGHGEPPGSNLLFTTEVYVLNLLGDTVAEYRLESYDEDGDPVVALRGGSGAVNALEGQIPPGGMVRVNSASNPGQVPLGWGLLRTSHGAVGLEVIFNIFDTTSGELLTATNVAVLPTLTATSFFVFNETRDGPLGQAPAGASRRVSSGLALVKPFRIPDTEIVGGEANVQLFALAKTGEIIAEMDVALQAGERVSMFVDQLIEGLPDFDGSIELRSNHPLNEEVGIPIGILPLRQEGVILTTQNLFPPRVLRER